MSETEASAGQKPRNRNNRNRSRKTQEPKEDEAATPTNTEPYKKVDERAERRRVETAPIPATLVGTKATGRVTDVIRKGGAMFGFINIGLDVGVKAKSDVPRIYFRLKEFDDSEYRARAGYFVEFLCKQEEDGRFFASEVKLTDEGRAHAVEKEARRKKGGNGGGSRTSGEGASKTGDETKPRSGGRRRPGGRKPNRDENEEDAGQLTLRVTCEGKSGEKEIVVKLSQTIGKLKHNAVVAFEAPVEYKVYCKDILLNKQMLKELEDMDVIHLAAPKA